MYKGICMTNTYTFSISYYLRSQSFLLHLSLFFLIPPHYPSSFSLSFSACTTFSPSQELQMSVLILQAHALVEPGMPLVNGCLAILFLFLIAKDSERHLFKSNKRAQLSGVLVAHLQVNHCQYAHLLPCKCQCINSVMKCELRNRWKYFIKKIWFGRSQIVVRCEFRKQSRHQKFGLHGKDQNLSSFPG